MTPEGKVKSWVKQSLKQLHEDEKYSVYSFWPVQTGMGASTLDALHCINGYFVAIETKAKGKTMTDRQETVAEAIRNAGGLVFVVDDKASLARAIEAIKDQCQL